MNGLDCEQFNYSTNIDKVVLKISIDFWDNSKQIIGNSIRLSDF